MTAPSILSNVSLLQINVCTAEDPERTMYQYGRAPKRPFWRSAQKLLMKTPQVLHQSKVLRRICLES